MKEFKAIGYKNHVATWALLIGSIIALILMIFVLVSKPNNYVIYFILFLLLTVIFFVSFVIEKTRPNAVVFLSNSSVKIWRFFAWKIIPFNNIDYIDYKLNVLKTYEAMFFDMGSLIIECKNRKFVIRDIDNVTDCHEKIVVSLKEYRHNKENQANIDDSHQ